LVAGSAADRKNPAKRMDLGRSRRVTDVSAANVAHLQPPVDNRLTMCWTVHHHDHRVARADRFGAIALQTRDPEEVAARRQRAYVARATRFGWIVAICVGIWLLSGAGYFWPAWVIVIGAIRLGMQARWAYSSSSDDGPQVPPREPDDDLVQA
jgi:hypothetical protein